MSETNSTTAAARLTQMWTDFASKMSAAGMTFSPDAAPTDATRNARAAMLSAMSKQTDEFMRSPEFNSMMKQMLDASMNLQLQSKEFLTQAHHAAQMPARQDVEALLASISHLEERVLQRLDELSARIDAVEGKKPRAGKARRQR